MTRLLKWLLILPLGLTACAPVAPTPLSQKDFADPPLIISEPGQFIFTEDITITQHHVHAIEIRSDNVNIHLNGFRLQGPGRASGHGVYQPPNRKNLSLEHGEISNWHGIRSYAVRAEGRANVFQDLRVLNSEGGIWSGDEAAVSHCDISDIDTFHDGYGIRAGVRSIISHCRVSGVHNRGAIGYGIFAGNESEIRYSRVTDCRSDGHMGYGIRTGRNSVITQSAAVSNTAAYIGYGIASGANSRIRASHAIGNRAGGDGYGIAGNANTVMDECVAEHNRANGRFSYGIQGGDNAVIQYSRAANNGGEATTAAGIVVGAKGTIRTSEVMENRMHGIWLSSQHVHALNNSVHSNGSAGILVSMNENTVENNRLTRNGIGLLVTGTMNDIRNNTVHDNKIDYDIAAGNTVE